MEFNTILFLVGHIIYGGYFIMNGLNHFQHADMLSGYAASKGVKSPGQFHDARFLENY